MADAKPAPTRFARCGFCGSDYPAGTFCPLCGKPRSHDAPTRKEDGKVQAEGQCQHKDLERIGHDEVFCLSCRHLCRISETVATGMQRWYPFPWKDGSNG